MRGADTRLQYRASLAGQAEYRGEPAQDKYHDPDDRDELPRMESLAGQLVRDDLVRQADARRGMERDSLPFHRHDGGDSNHQADDGPPWPRASLHLCHLPGNIELPLLLQVHAPTLPIAASA